MADEGNASEASSEALEQEARELGWVPQPDFKGNPERWIPAEQFVERGRHILPIVKENNDRLRGELKQSKGEVTKLHDQLKTLQESISALEEYHEEDAKRKVEQAKRALLEQLKDAKREGDVDREVELTAELADLKREERPPGKVAKPADQDRPQLKPEDQATFQQWQSENKWFGMDKRRTALAMATSNQLRADGDQRVGRPFLDAIAKEVDDILGPIQGGGSKVEGSRGGARGGTGLSKSWHDLPADARDACDGFADRLVGPGKAYKSIDDWRAKYVKDYFEE